MIASRNHINPSYVHVNASPVHVNGGRVHVNGGRVHVNGGRVHMNGGYVHMNVTCAHDIPNHRDVVLNHSYTGINPAILISQQFIYSKKSSL